MGEALYSSYADYILTGATWTSSVSPMTGYDVTNLAYMRPDWRIKWSVKTVTITATLGVAAQADVVAVPMSNLDGGLSPTILRVTNNQSLDINPEFPTVPGDDLPLTMVYDFRTAPNASTPATVWNFVIANNSVNVTLGALLWLGRLRDLVGFRPEFELGEDRFNEGERNFFGVENPVRARTRMRWADFSVPSRDADRDALFEWARAGEGAGKPSLFWMDPSVNDALIGKWPNTYSSRWVVSNYSPMDGIRFVELNKGLPLL